MSMGPPATAPMLEAIAVQAGTAAGGGNEPAGLGPPVEMGVATEGAGSTTVGEECGARGIVAARTRSGDAEPIPAEELLAVVRAAGYEPSAILRRGAHHLEILASRGGRAFEVHLALDGRIRHVAPTFSAAGTSAGHR
jgi:hypothetical protein